MAQLVIAKECQNEPDKRGRQSMAQKLNSSASVVTGGSKGSSAMASSTTQQSWYVILQENARSFHLIHVFIFRVVENTILSVGINETTLNLFVVDDPEDECQGSELKGIGVFDPPDMPFCGSCSFFCGLTTCPTMGVVDTAAQDGLVGHRALERLEEKLSACSLRVRWTGEQAKAHGVGGQAVVKGIVAIPLGIAGTSGLLEATVVEGDIPLLCQ